MTVYRRHQSDEKKGPAEAGPYRTPNHEPRTTNYESRITNPESRTPNHEPRITNPESRTPNHESRIPNHESRTTNHESRIQRSSLVPALAGGGTVSVMPCFARAALNACARVSIASA